MAYVDGFVLAVPEANKQAYIDLAVAAGVCFRDYGALEMVECWGEDVPDGVLTSFPMAVKKEPGEIVVLSWIVWPDKATRDAAHPRMETDERMAGFIAAPFDGKRLIFGGFEEIVRA